MTRLERLEGEIHASGINMWDVPPSSPYLGGRPSRLVCTPDGYHIFVSTGLTSRARYCVLGHEYGHYHTGNGGIIASSGADVDYQEARAWRWAYLHLIPRDELAHLMPARPDAYELAEHFEVPIWFVRSAVDFYSNHYSLYRLDA